MPTPHYRRVTRRRRTPAGSSELWLADDHLLLVMRHWWTENYQRFRLTDIRSMLIAERPSLRGIQIAGLIVTALLWALTMFQSNGVAFKIVLGGPLSITLLWQLVDLWRGPYCRVELSTAVSAVRLSPLSRTRRAVRFVEELAPLIERAQGRWTPEPPPVPAMGEATAEWTLSGGPSPLAAPPPLPSDEGGRIGAMAQSILFGSTVVIGIYGLAANRIDIPPRIAIGLWTIASMPMVVGILVAISGRGAAIRILAAGATLASLFFGVGSFAGYVAAVSAAVQNRTDPAKVAESIPIRSKFGDAPGVALAAIGSAGAFLVARRAMADRPRAGE